MYGLNCVMDLLAKQKIVDECTHKGWKVKCFFGPSPIKETVLEYSACAITNDVSTALEPVLSKNNCIQVTFDNKRSIIWWSASTKSILTRKVKLALTNFQWTKPEDRANDRREHPNDSESN